MEAFNYFVKYLFLPINGCLTLFGCTFGMLILSHQKMKKIGPVKAYQYLFASEYFNLIIIIQSFVLNALGIDAFLVSSIMCKILKYFYYIYDSIPPMLIVYISIERYVSITYPSKKLLLRKKKTQLIYLISVMAYVFTSYVFVLFYIDIIPVDSTSNMTLKCSFNDSYVEHVIEYIDLIVSLLIPFILMIFCTILLTYRIVHSRRKLKAAICTANTGHKYLKFSLTSLLLNMFYLVLCFPFHFSEILFPNVNLNIFYFLKYMVFLCYGLDFYLVYISNSLFRCEFYKIFNFAQSFLIKICKLKKYPNLQ